MAQLPATAYGADSSGFPLLEMSVDELQKRMQSGKLTAQRLVVMYLERIRAIDERGPKLRAIIELNPDAADIAKQLDRERKQGKVRGPLHGIPVLIKDNIATADRMHTTAGSLALVDAKAPRDAAIVQRLREAGAVILGKTNLSEWANIRSTRSISGWSGRGGQTRNPYALDRNTSGSSSGSGAAMAANLAAIAIGTETDGSIVSPASICGLVGIKPTVGLVSRSGIIPISHSQDTAGPMTRTVADAAALLSAIAGADAHDAATTAAASHATDYTRFLQADGLRGARIGVVRSYFAESDRVDPIIDRALTVLKAQGAELIDPVELPAGSQYGDDELVVLLTEFKADLAAYLADYAPTASIKSLADVIAFNRAHAAQEMPWFSQELFEQAEAKGGLDDAAYLKALANSQRVTREGIDQAIAKHRLDALVAPTGSPAWLIDPVNGDRSGGSFSSPAAVAGYPHITVPAGFSYGLPIGLSFVGPAWSEPTLIKLAYAFEQATKHRRPPQFLKTAKLD